MPVVVLQHPSERCVVDEFEARILHCPAPPLNSSFKTSKAAEAGSHLGVIVGCGSLVEGLLTWALLKKKADALQSSKAQKDKEGRPLPIQQWYLPPLIDVCVELGLIGKTAKQAAWALKDFRNFIHPYNVLQQSARPDRALALSSQAALAEILRSLSGRAE